jgi:outer membrane receptor for ferrienterochelin and colicins
VRLVFLLTLISTLALSDNAADEADVAFSRGNSAFAKRDYQGALGAYFLSNRLVPNRNVLFNIARCYEALGESDLAWRYWHDVSLEGGLPLEDGREVELALDRLTPKVALLAVESTPPGASIFIDRKDLGARGKTPQVFALSPGKHSVILELEWHAPQRFEVFLARGKRTKSTATLIAMNGKIHLEGTPMGAEVHETNSEPSDVNGGVLGTLPADLTLSPGLHILLVQAPGFLDKQVVLEVKPNQTTTTSVRLEERPKPTGHLEVTSNRANSTVKVNGQRAGFTPTVLTLPEGEYDVEVSSDEAAPFSKHLRIAAGSENQLAAELRFAAPTVQAASTHALAADEAPASVTVLSKDELRAFGYQTVAEALRGVRGFFLADDRIYTYVGLRGFSPPGDLNTRLLILWDGHPMNDVWAGQGFAARDLDVDLNEIESLEIVRGPASILFGTGAFFGVINVVPRKNLGANKNVEVVGAFGEQNAGKLRATGTIESSGSSVLLSAGAFQSEGAPLTNLDAVGPVLGLDGERSLGLSTKATSRGFTLLGKINQRRKQVPTAPFGAAPGLAGTEYTDARGFAELRFEHSFGAEPGFAGSNERSRQSAPGRVNLKAKVSYDGSRYRGYFAQAAGIRDTDSGGGDWGTASIQLGIQLFLNNRLTAGLEGQAAFVTQQPAGVTSQQQNRFLVSGTLLDEWQLGAKVFLQVGLRVDRYFDLSEFVFSPRAAAVAHWYQQGLTKAVVGRAFRAPTIYESYFSDNNRTLRAPDMIQKPEFISTLELEHSHNFTEEFRVTAAGYVNFIEGLLEKTLDQNGTPRCVDMGVPQQCTAYGNSPGNVTAMGAELQARWQPGRFTIVDASYSFVWLSGPNVPAYPMNLAALKAVVPLKEGLVRLATQATYQSARLSQGTPIGESLNLNLGFSGEYGFFRYYAGIQNLLDSRVVLPVSSEASTARVPQYGRTVWVEVAATF